MEVEKFAKELRRYYYSKDDNSDTMGMLDIVFRKHNKYSDNPDIIDLDLLDMMIEKVERWSRNNPIETRQDNFLKLFPDCEINSGFIDICPYSIDTSHKCSECSNCNSCKSNFERLETDKFRLFYSKHTLSSSNQKVVDEIKEVKKNYLNKYF